MLLLLVCLLPGPRLPSSLSSFGSTAYVSNMFGIKTRSINLLLTIGILVNYSTADKQRSNLRVAKAKLYDKKKHVPPSSNLRASVTNNNDERRLSSLFNHVAVEEVEDHSSITLNKQLYAEEESITVSFNLGSHRITPSSDYSIGLFMRDADPQGGTLSPIVSINICNVANCNDDKINDFDLDVTFGNDHGDIMKGVWPLENSEYGTGFDAYVLDGQGAAAIGPFEFYIKSQEEVSAAESSTAKKDKSLERFKKKNGLVAKSSSNVKSLVQMKNDAIKEKEVETTAKEVNKKIVKGNGLEMSSSAIPQSSSIHKTSQVEEEAKEQEVVAASTEEKETEEDDEVCCSTMKCNKDKYREDEEVSFNFNIINDRPEDDLSKYTVGFYMRMAHVENLDPIVSLPLCSGEGGCSTSSVDGSTSGSVTFSSETMQQMSGSSWPIDLYEWGTGIDAYILDESGNEVVGPVKFDFLMNDTY